MSRIYDALKKLEAERAGKNGKSNGHGNGAGANGANGANGNGRNGHGNGNGNGNGKGRRGWQWLFPGVMRAKRNGGTTAVNFELGPEVEEAYQRLGTNLLASPGRRRPISRSSSASPPRDTARAPPPRRRCSRRSWCGGAAGEWSSSSATSARRRFETVFGIKRDGGFAELVQGKESLAEVAQPTSVPNLFAISAGDPRRRPAALFDSPGLSAALEQLREQFDFVIFDLPPVNVYGDALILGPRLDAALIVIEADRTRVAEVERTRRTPRARGRAVRRLGAEPPAQLHPGVPRGDALRPGRGPAFRRRPRCRDVSSESTPRHRRRELHVARARRRRCRSIGGADRRGDATSARRSSSPRRWLALVRRRLPASSGRSIGIAVMTARFLLAAYPTLLPERSASSRSTTCSGVVLRRAARGAHPRDARPVVPPHPPGADPDRRSASCS